MSFSTFNLKEDFISSIEAAGYKSPTPLQSQLIPLVAKRESALVWTQSASGKTGSFLIPAINYILENPALEKRGARILILTSRRDRVSQINYTIKRLSSNHVMRFGFIVSGRPYQTQMRLMRRPLDIMIATPGRLNDLMNNGKADFSQLEMLVVDDLTSIYQKNLQGLVEKIIEQSGSDCQTLTFVRDEAEVTSYAKALFSSSVQITVKDDGTDVEQEPVQNNIKNKKNMNTSEAPAKVSIDMANLMSQQVYIADDYTHKIAMMDHFMDEFAGQSTIIYVSSYKSAKMLQDNLANHGHAAELLQDLDLGEINDQDIIIISDLDKTEISEEMLSNNDDHIIHFDLPRRTERYLERLKKHKQQREESALLMIDGYNYNELKHIEKTIDAKLDQVHIPGLEPLKPFVNLSKSKPRQKPNRTAKTAKSNSTNNRTRNNKSTKNPRNKKSTNEVSNTDNKRQRKGAFGRLNGGANRKKTGARVKNNRTKVGVSSRGTAAPQGDRGWQSDFAEPKERKSESKNVVIRYSNKRSLIDKSDQ